MGDCDGSARMVRPRANSFDISELLRHCLRYTRVEWASSIGAVRATLAQCNAELPELSSYLTAGSGSPKEIRVLLPRGLKSREAVWDVWSCQRQPVVPYRTHRCHGN